MVNTINDAIWTVNKIEQLQDEVQKFTRTQEFLDLFKKLFTIHCLNISHKQVSLMWINKEFEKINIKTISLTFDVNNEITIQYFYVWDYDSFNFTKDSILDIDTKVSEAFERNKKTAEKIISDKKNSELERKLQQFEQLKQELGK